MFLTKIFSYYSNSKVKKDSWNKTTIINSLPDNIGNNIGIDAYDYDHEVNEEGKKWMTHLYQQNWFEP